MDDRNWKTQGTQDEEKQKRNSLCYDQYIL